MNQTTRTRSAMHQRSNPLDSDLLQILLFYILPFIVINSIIFFVVTAKPKYELTVAPTNDYQTTTATFKITSHMPLKNVTITFNSQPLDLCRKENLSGDFNGEWNPGCLHAEL